MKTYHSINQFIQTVFRHLLWFFNLVVLLFWGVYFKGQSLVQIISKMETDLGELQKTVVTNTDFLFPFVEPATVQIDLRIITVCLLVQLIIRIMFLEDRNEDDHHTHKSCPLLPDSSQAKKTASDE